jgi:PAS domain S-box-containing protein
MTVFDLREKQLLFINEGGASMLGYSVNALKRMTHGERVKKLIHPEDAHHIQSNFEALAGESDKYIHTQEYRMFRKNGTMLWVSNRSQVFRRNAAGEVVQIISIVQDITEEKKNKQQLSDRADFINKLIDCSIDSIYVLDKEWTVLEWNQRCEERYKVKREAIIGRYFFDFFPKVKDHGAIMNAMKGAFEGESVSLPPAKEIYTDAVCERFYIPLKQDEGSVFAVLCTMHDVSALQAAKQELRQVNKVL